MIACLSVFHQKMAASQVSSVKSQKPWKSFTRALALAFYEWLLIFMLFMNALFSYLITKFADYSQLQSPCLLCSRLDHILGKKRVNHFWELICSKHKSEISSLVYCHAHDKLVDVHAMCETCLFSFATINKSNSETYRLLVGKLGDNSSLDLNNDPSYGSVSQGTKHCSCCNQPWVPRVYTQVSEPEVQFKIPALRHVKTERQTVQVRDVLKKKVGFYNLPHVGYTELKFHSDTESEAVFSDDEERTRQHMFQTVDLEPRVITLPYDLATDKLIDPLSASESSVSVANAETNSIGHGLEELHLQDIDSSKNSASILQPVSCDAVPETSSKVTEKDFISFNDVPVTSQGKEKPDYFAQERELISLRDIILTDFMGNPSDPSSPSNIHETSANGLMETGVIPHKDVSLPMCAEVSPADVLQGIELIPLNDVPAISEVQKNDGGVLCLEEVSQSFTTKETSHKASNESKSTPANDIFAASEAVTSFSSESVEPIAEVETINCETERPQIEETRVADNHELHLVRDGHITTQETTLSSTSSISVIPSHEVPSISEVTEKSTSSSMTTESNPPRGDSVTQRSDSLDLTDAYKIAVGNGCKPQSSVVQTEQCTGKDSNRISEDLKALLTQISASRGIELLSPRDISPKISVNGEDLKNLDDMQLLLQKRFLERNESNLSLDGVAVSEIEGESEIDRLKRQVDHDIKLLTGVCKELEEERNASAIAANQAMAMITRLQEDKASFQMEALQNLRMMEEQAEYDMEAMQKLNDLLAEREKEIQDLETELEFYRNQTPSASTMAITAEQNERSKISENPGESVKADVAEKVSEVGLPPKRMSNMINTSLLGFEDERLYINDCLKKIEKKLHLFSNHGLQAVEEDEEVYDLKHENGETQQNQSKEQENVSSYEKSLDKVSVEDEVSELHERLERLKGDLYFLEHAINSLGHGNEGMQFIKEIASHLHNLRSLSMVKQVETER